MQILSLDYLPGIQFFGSISTILLGCKLLDGYLVGKGIKVPRSRVREAYYAVKGEMGLMVALPVRRRQYYVTAPMTLWHIDGHHKLIR